MTKALLGEVLSKLSSKGDILRIKEAADVLRTLFSLFSNVLEHVPFSACCVQCHAVRSRSLTVLGPGFERSASTWLRAAAPRIIRQCLLQVPTLWCYKMRPSCHMPGLAWVPTLLVLTCVRQTSTGFLND